MSRRYNVRFDDNVQEIESCCTYESKYSQAASCQNFKIDLNSVKYPHLKDKIVYEDS